MEKKFDNDKQGKPLPIFLYENRPKIRAKSKFDKNKITDLRSSKVSSKYIMEFST